MMELASNNEKFFGVESDFLISPTSLLSGVSLSHCSEAPNVSRLLLAVVQIGVVHFPATENSRARELS